MRTKCLAYSVSTEREWRSGYALLTGRAKPICSIFPTPNPLRVSGMIRRAQHFKTLASMSCHLHSHRGHTLEIVAAYELILREADSRKSTHVPSSQRKLGSHEAKLCPVVRDASLRWHDGRVSAHDPIRNALPHMKRASGWNQLSAAKQGECHANPPPAPPGCGRGGGRNPAIPSSPPVKNESASFRQAETYPDRSPSGFPRHPRSSAAAHPHPASPAQRKSAP